MTHNLWLKDYHFNPFWGFGNRKNFLQFWTSLQQLICAQSITGLQVGEGGEEEVEVACLAVRGLQSLCLQAASKLSPVDIESRPSGVDHLVFGSPVCTKIEKNSRCPRPRLINSPELLKSQIFVENEIFSSLFLDSPNHSQVETMATYNKIGSEWTECNVEEIGSSVDCLSQVNSAGYFRRLGISPTVSLKVNQTNQNQEQNTNSNPPSYWSPDLESSVQFLFDLFLRWLHFAKVDSTETPNHRIIGMADRSPNVFEVRNFPHFKSILTYTGGRF